MTKVEPEDNSVLRGFLSGLTPDELNAVRAILRRAPERSKARRPITIRDLYPQFTEAQLKETEENLQRYAEHALRAYERLIADPVAYAELQKRLAEEERRNKGAGLAA